MSLVLNGTTGIVSANIQDGTIVGADIANGTITANKIDPVIGITYPMLSNSATESDNVARRTAKAWVNFNGSGTPAIRNDFNVSSITDNGVGDYTINFTSTLSSSDYAVTATSRATVDNGGVASLNFNSAPATGSCRIRTIHTANAFMDSEYVFVVIHL